MDTKRCNGCGEQKQHSEFSKVKPGRGDRFNLASRCKKCRAAKNLAHMHANPLKKKKWKKSWYLKNREHSLKYAKEWNEKNPGKRKEIFFSWARKNLAKLNAKQSARKAKILQANPLWNTWLDNLLIQEIYEICRAVTTQTGIKHHVDHIIPLQGETVCGLHVPSNLRVIPAFQNISKKNRFNGDIL